MEAAGGIEPPYGALQENVSSRYFPTSERYKDVHCTFVAHRSPLPSVWPAESLRALPWGVMAEDVKTKACPNCATEVDAATKVCPHCHYFFKVKVTSARAWTIAAIVLLLIIAAGLYQRHLRDVEREGEACAERTVFAITHNLPDPHCV